MSENSTIQKETPQMSFGLSQTTLNRLSVYSFVFSAASFVGMIIGYMVQPTYIYIGLIIFIVSIIPFFIIEYNLIKGYYKKNKNNAVFWKRLIAILAIIGIALLIFQGIRINTLKSKVIKLQEILIMQSAKLSSYEKDILKLRNSNDSLNGFLVKFEGEIQNYKKTINELNQKIREAENKLNAPLIGIGKVEVSNVNALSDSVEKITSEINAPSNYAEKDVLDYITYLERLYLKVSDLQNITSYSKEFLLVRIDLHRKDLKYNYDLYEYEQSTFLELKDKKIEISSKIELLKNQFPFLNN